MYYRSVNRGLSFTKPGLYTFGFILFTGMIAVATGVNGLYLVLALGLGGFIISGLLSEKLMRSCRVTSVGSTITQAGVPHELRVRVENSSGWFHIHLMTLEITSAPPRLRLISKPLNSLLSGTVASLPPASTDTLVLSGKGLPRGLHQSLTMIQLTTFPFGLLEKFRIDNLPTSVTVTPGIDQDYLSRLIPELTADLRARSQDEEFSGHRSYTRSDSLRRLDRKKSAGKPTTAWVVKTFETPAVSDDFLIEAPLAQGVDIADESAYERWLSRVMTACKAVADLGMPVSLDLGDGRLFTGVTACSAALAAVPGFTYRRSWQDWLDQQPADRVTRGKIARSPKSRTMVITPAATDRAGPNLQRAA